MMALIARWPTEDAMLESPSVVRWEDGSPATLEDYHKHLVDTHTWVLDSRGGIEQRIFPDIVADVRYDPLAGVWGLSGQSVQPAALSLTDPNATDEQIVAELYTFPLTYCARIHR